MCIYRGRFKTRELAGYIGTVTLMNQSPCIHNIVHACALIKSDGGGNFNDYFQEKHSYFGKRYVHFIITTPLTGFWRSSIVSQSSLMNCSKQAASLSQSKVGSFDPRSSGVP